MTLTLIIPDITKTKSNKCFTVHCFKDNIDKLKHTVATLSKLIEFPVLQSSGITDNFNPRTYAQSHTPTVVQEGGEG